MESKDPYTHPNSSGRRGCLMLAQPRTNASLLAIAMLFTLSIGVAAQQTPEKLARQSAESWLALVDSGKYAESWQEAASPFKSHVTKEDWQKMMHSARDPLGKLISRKLKSASYTKTLPGAPDGKYVIIQYETSFEHKQSAIETITPMLDKDGQWRVSGYFIK